MLYLYMVFIPEKPTPDKAQHVYSHYRQQLDGTVLFSEQQMVVWGEDGISE